MRTFACSRKQRDKYCILYYKRVTRALHGQTRESDRDMDGAVWPVCASLLRATPLSKIDREDRDVFKVCPRARPQVF